MTLILRSILERRKDMKNKNKRVNRAQIEWMKILDPYEYVLIDKMLFQSNLTKANNGQGFKFHIRQLEKETKLDKNTISRRFKKWHTFITKHGERFESEFIFHYQECIKYMENLMLTVSVGDKTVSVGDKTVCAEGQPLYAPKDKTVCAEGHRSIKEVLDKEEEKKDIEVANPEIYNNEAKSSEPDSLQKQVMEFHKKIDEAKEQQVLNEKCNFVQTLSLNGNGNSIPTELWDSIFPK